MLAEFWTSIAWDPDSAWNRVFPPGLRNQLMRRVFSQAPPGRVHSVPSREVVRLAARYLPFGSVLGSGESPFSVTGIYRQLDDRVAQRLRNIEVDAVYAYEGGALQTFRVAKEQGVATFCEMQSSHWRWWHELLREEVENKPEFAALLPHLNDSTRHLEEKDEELHLADAVFLPSQHVRRTLCGAVPDEKIHVISYGAPPVRWREHIARESTGPLKVLFVGALGQSKGIGYLLDAIDLLGSQVNLTLVGRRLGAHPRVDGACSRWRWFSSLPHSDVLELMQAADILVLPSLAEGCALVVLEALACGLPVIVTPNTGVLDYMQDGREGFVVPIRDADSIAERLSTISRDRALLARMSQSAQITAAARSWEAYRNTWAATIKDAIWR